MKESTEQNKDESKCNFTPNINKSHILDEKQFLMVWYDSTPPSTEGNSIELGKRT